MAVAEPVGEMSSSPAVPTGLTRRAAMTRGSQRMAATLVGVGGFYVALVLFFALTTSDFATDGNARIVLTQAAVIGIISLGQLVVVLGGGFDLSVAGVAPLSGVVFVSLTNDGTGVAAAIALALLVATAFGVLNGLIVTKLEVNPLVTTLGTMSIGQGLAFTVTDGQTERMENIGASFLANTVPGEIPIFAVVFVVLGVAMALMLRRTLYGRSIYAVGGSREASRLAGMRVDSVVTSTYAISGLLAGLAGIVLASQLLAGSPTAGTDSALTSVAAVVLGGAALTGGVGGVGGTVLGVLLLGTLANGMALQGIQPFYQLIATGVVLLLAVGLGWLKTFRPRRWSR